MAAPPSPIQSVAGALAGRYELGDELGRGGMATVYRARDLKHERRVAIKVLHPDLTASVGAERFLREIRIAAQLAHPHILPLLDSGAAGNVLYYVMPLVDGGSLRQRLDRPLELDDALRILREIGAALDYAHRQGYVHRDVKPENILFADGVAVLADFGIARACCGPGADGVTEIGLALGTPEYMSPEQVAGERDLSGRSDIYSLATLAWEMLAGHPPLAGSGPRETMARQITDIPPSVRTLRPEVPSGIEYALAKAMAKDPAGRFDTVADFLTALTDWAAVSVAPTLERCVAVVPFVNTGGDPSAEFLSDGLTDELINALVHAGGLKVASRTSVFGLKGQALDVRSIGARLGAAWVIEGSVRTIGQRLRVTAQLSSTVTGEARWSERFDRTIDDVFAIQEEIARTIVDTLRASLIELPESEPRAAPKNPEAYELYLKGRFAWNKRSGEGVAEAMELFQRAVVADPEYAPAYAGLADAYALQLDYRAMPVAEGFAKAREYARRALELDETLAEAHASLAWTLFIYDWDWEQSGREYRRAIELDPGYATAHQWYAFWLAIYGRFPEAIAGIHRAQELDPASVSIRRTVGWVYYYARRFDHALHHMTKAVTMNPTSDETRRVLGLAYAMQGKWPEAEAAFGAALDLSLSSYNAAMLGWLYGKTGRAAEAQAIARELTDRAAKEYVSPVAMATVWLGVGDLDQVFAELDRAFIERRGWLAYLTVNPIADPLRADPRYDALVRKMRL